MPKPLKLAASPLTGNVYAFRQFKIDGAAIIATGHREDITTEFKREMNNIVRKWVDEKHLEVTVAGASVLNKFFALPTPDTAPGDE